jgi:DNA-binding NarL/FixJ family response regulator
MDLVLVDIGLPDSVGYDTLRQLRALRDDVPIVVVSGFTDHQTVLQAIEWGAMGFVPKTAASQDMLQAFKVVLGGGLFLPPETGQDAGDGQRPLALTPRQWDILRRVLEGKSIKHMALDLGISEATVKAHITPVLRALGATTRTEAIVKAVQLGLRFPR